MNGPIDIHVHILGNGSGGSGCWMRRSWWRRPVEAIMARRIGLPASAIAQNLEELYVQRLAYLVRSSSLAKAVVLAQEQAYDDHGQSMRKPGMFHVPNDYVFKVCGRHSEFAPGISIHPGRPDALDELERCLAAGAVLMKILPNCQNIDCGRKRYRPFWERMAAAGLPLLAHTGGEYVLPAVRPELADPRTLESPLDCGVKVIAAHCATRSGLWDPQWFPAFKEMVRHYPNCYGDISAFNVENNRTRGSILAECLRPPLCDRLLHGSDYPVPASGFWPWLKGSITCREYRRWQAEPNVLERDYQLKRAAGFPEAVFTRAWQVLRWPHSVAA